MRRVQVAWTTTPHPSADGCWVVCKEDHDICVFYCTTIELKWGTAQDGWQLLNYNYGCNWFWVIISWSKTFPRKHVNTLWHSRNSMFIIQSFRIEFYRFYRICRKIFKVVLKMKITKILFYKFYRFCRILFGKPQMLALITNRYYFSAPLELLRNSHRLSC